MRQIKAGDIVCKKADRSTAYLVESLVNNGGARLLDTSGAGHYAAVSELEPVQILDKQLEPAQTSETKSETDKLLSERGNRYGSFASVAQISQELKAVMHNSPNWHKLTPSQKEALEMVQHKIARMLNGDPTYIDNPVDIVGYATLMMKNMQGDLSI